jgi:hypothetical protein
MAATVDSSLVYVHGGMIEQHVVLSSLVSDQTETITINTGLGAPNKVAPFDVGFEYTAGCTDGSALHAPEHLVASDSTSGNTVAVRARVESGGDITGAKLKVKIRWLEVARQDGQSINSANNT